MVLRGVLASHSDAIQTKTWLLYTRVARPVNNVTVARPLSYNVPQVGILMDLVYQLKVAGVGNFHLKKLLSHIGDNFLSHLFGSGLHRQWQFSALPCLKKLQLIS
jgi:hypothetical protein